MMVLTLQEIKKFAARRQVRRAVLVTVAAFIVLNVGIGAYYSKRTLPNTWVGDTQIGSVPYSRLPKALAAKKILPTQLKLKYESKVATYKTADIGISLDNAKIQKTSAESRSWLPLYGVLSRHELKPIVRVDEAKFAKSYTALSVEFSQQPIDAQIVVDNGLFVLKSDTKGYQLTKAQTRKTIVGSINNNQNSVVLRVSELTAKTSRKSLQSRFDSLQKQQKTTLVYHYQSSSKQLSQSDVAALYEPSGNDYQLSEQHIKSKLTNIGSNFGIRIQNIDEAVDSTKDSIQKSQKLDFTLVPIIVTRSFSYCVQSKGVDTANLGTFKAKLASTYADSRGWSVGGKISYAQVESGCDFTVWLAAADQLPSFGAICDTMWSCTVSPNVIINYDRWAGASSAWNAAGGSLDDYRSMVINHETGHWLGFGHRYCAGAGQAAPVMQQQSIDLQGCKFSPWPSSSELDSLRSWLGI